uniref:Uncharacterized protein n=1 Tax=Oryza punctata TaxID=4537 RepID=A0A0E0JJ20_ORYPU
MADDHGSLKLKILAKPAFDTRPRALAYYLCLQTDREEEGSRWNAAYGSQVRDHRPRLPGRLHRVQGDAGVRSVQDPAVRMFVAPSALREVDADLPAEQDKTRRCPRRRGCTAELSACTCTPCCGVWMGRIARLYWGSTAMVVRFGPNFSHAVMPSHASSSRPLPLYPAPHPAVTNLRRKLRSAWFE